MRKRLSPLFIQAITRYFFSLFTKTMTSQWDTLVFYAQRSHELVLLAMVVVVRVVKWLRLKVCSPSSFERPRCRRTHEPSPRACSSRGMLCRPSRKLLEPVRGARTRQQHLLVRLESTCRTCTSLAPIQYTACVRGVFAC